MKGKIITILIICGLLSAFTGCKSKELNQEFIPDDVSHPKKVEYSTKELTIDEEYQKQLKEKYASYSVVNAEFSDDGFLMYEGDRLTSDVSGYISWQASAIELNNGYILSRKLFMTDTCKAISELSKAATLHSISGTNNDSAITGGELLSYEDVKVMLRDVQRNKDNYGAVTLNFYDKTPDDKIIISVAVRNDNIVRKWTNTRCYDSGYIICENKQLKIQPNRAERIFTSESKDIGENISYSEPIEK